MKTKIVKIIISILIGYFIFAGSECNEPSNTNNGENSTVVKELIMIRDSKNHTWIERDITRDYTENHSIAFYDGLFRAENGNVFKSTNYGGNWLQIFSGSVGDRDIQALDAMYFSAGSFVYFTSKNKMGISLNGGGNWSAYTQNGDYSVKFAPDSQNHMIGVRMDYVPQSIGGSYYKFSKSTDYGQSWDSNSSAIVSGLSLNICSSPPTSLNIKFIALTSNSVFASTNSGDSWQKTVGPNEFLSWNDIEFINNNLAIAGGKNIFLTADYGYNWSNITPSGLSETFQASPIVDLDSDNDGTMVALTRGAIYSAYESAPTQWYLLYGLPNANYTGKKIIYSSSGTYQIIVLATKEIN